MRRELQEIEHIENYLMGNMNEAQKAEFEQELKNDSTFAEKVEAQQAVIVGLERIGLKNDLARAKKSLYLRKVGTWVGVLLLGLAGVGVFYILEENKLILKEVVNSSTDESSLAKNERRKVKSEVAVSFEALQAESSTGTEESDTSILLEKHQMVSDVSILAKNPSITEVETVELPQKEFQTFTINPTKENTIRGKEGTVIQFPKDAFGTEKGKVIIKLKEFYKYSDMVFANLSTQTKDGQLIETGGMVNIEAYNTAKKKLKLQEGKPIEIKFPFENKKEGMKTFSGSRNELANVVWEEQEDFEIGVDMKITEQISKPLLTEEVQVFTIVEDMPKFSGCEGETERKNWQECTNNAIHNYLSKNLKVPYYELGITGKNRVLVRCLIDERGLTQNVKILKSTNKLLNDYAQVAILSLPRFTPGKQRGKPVKVQYTIPITFNIGEDYSNMDLISQEKVKEILELKRAELEEKKRQNLEGFMGDTTVSAIQKSDYMKFNTLNSTSLGYINCDRYPFAKNGKSSFSVLGGDQGISCSVVLHKVRGVVSPRYIKRGKYIFPQLPNREKVSVLAFKNEEGKNYVSYKVSTHDGSNHSFDFKPLTEELLSKITAELDAIRN